MSTDIAQRDALVGLTRDQVDLVKRTVAKDASDDELALFLHHCKTTGLDPLSNQIYWIKRGNEGRPQVAIGGARLVAERTGRYRPGHTLWYDDAGATYEVWLKDTPPAASRVTVFKDGVEVPGRAVTYKERAQNTPTWKSMPATMLAKCAEMDTLRTAFPQELSGLYSPEEMGSEHPVSTPRTAITAAPDPVGPTISKAQALKVTEALDALVASGTDRSELDARLADRYGTSEVELLTTAQADDLLAKLGGA